MYQPTFRMLTVEKKFRISFIFNGNVIPRVWRGKGKLQPYHIRIKSYLKCLALNIEILEFTKEQLHFMFTSVITLQQKF